MFVALQPNLSKNKHWYQRMCQHLSGFTSQQQAFETMVAMRGHHDQIALVFFCGGNDGLGNLIG